MARLPKEAYLTALNNYCQDWGNKRLNGMKWNIAKMVKATSNHGLGLSSSLKFSLKRNRDGSVERLSFNMKRSGIMFQKNVGRGRPVGRAGREEQPWFNDSINDGLPEFVDFVTENCQDMVVNASRILVD